MFSYKKLDPNIYEIKEFNLEGVYKVINYFTFGQTHNHKRGYPLKDYYVKVEGNNYDDYDESESDSEQDGYNDYDDRPERRKPINLNNDYD